MKKNLPPKKEAAKTTDTNSAKPPFKMEVALMLFIQHGEQGMNTLEANQLYGDTALHSTVSDATNKHGINFKHQPEGIQNRVGTISRFTRYSLLSDDDVLRAKKLINNYRARRGLSPLIWEVAA